MAVVRADNIKWDLENVPLQISTTSRNDSGHRITIKTGVGLITVKLDDPLYFHLSSCNDSSMIVGSPTNNPINIWIFKKSAGSLEIYCNGDLIVNVQFTISNGCKNRWYGDMVNIIRFPTTDKASQWYKAGNRMLIIGN